MEGDRPGRILIVDDQPGAREALKSVLLPEGFDIHEASSGEEALEKLPELRPDVVLLDIMMPGMDGNEVCRQIREDEELAQTPVVMVTALDDRESKLQATWSGADDFITKPIDRDVVRARVRSIARVNRYRTLLLERERVDRLVTYSPDGILLATPEADIIVANPAAYRMKGFDPDRARLDGASLWSFLELDEDDHLRERLGEVLHGEVDSVSAEIRVNNTSRDAEVPLEITAVRFPMEEGAGLQLAVRDLTERYEQMETIRRLNDELLTAYDATLEGWVAALDLRHNETKGHTQRVTSMTVELARGYDFDEEELQHVRRGALLHDIGKIGIPDSILLKPGPLNEGEWAVMRMHPVYAYEWLSGIEYLEPALDIPRYHHEWWDGTGYPDGMEGSAIPLPARLFAPVDVFDALTSIRSYRQPMSNEEALEEIREGAGIHFDPQVVERFVHLVETDPDFAALPDPDEASEYEPPELMRDHFEAHRKKAMEGQGGPASEAAEG